MEDPRGRAGDVRHVLVALVQDEPGHAGPDGESLRPAPGYNVESFTAGASELPGVTRITIVVEGSSTALDQVAKQFRKLVGAVKVADVTADKDQLAYEMLLVKVGVTCKDTAGGRQPGRPVQGPHRGRLLDHPACWSPPANRTSWTSCSRCLKPFGIKEQARTGAVFMGRGAKILDRRPLPRPATATYLTE